MVPHPGKDPDYRFWRFMDSQSTLPIAIATSRPMSAIPTAKKKNVRTTIATTTATVKIRPARLRGTT